MYLDRRCLSPTQSPRAGWGLKRLWSSVASLSVEALYIVLCLYYLIDRSTPNQFPSVRQLAAVTHRPLRPLLTLPLLRQRACLPSTILAGKEEGQNSCRKGGLIAKWSRNDDALRSSRHRSEIGRHDWWPWLSNVECLPTLCGAASLPQPLPVQIHPML